MDKRIGKCSAAAALMLSAAILAAGCGGGTDTASTGTKAASTTTASAAEEKPAVSEAAVEQPAASSDELVFTENIVGTEGEYGYELWKDRGDTTFKLGEGGAFSCEWKNINNALFRRGQKFDCTKTYEELGNISVNYGVDYKPDGNSYMCVYGWTRDTLIEFYIVDCWGTWRPPGAPAALGSVVVDGAEYDIYKTTRYEQPSIDGTQTFDQFWSVRKQKPTPVEGSKLEGTISVSKHFDAWKKCGLELGKMYEIALTIEGYQSAGTADVYRNELSIGGTYAEADDIEVTVNEAAAGAGNGDMPPMPAAAGFFESDFEDGTSGWFPRGSAAVETDADNFSDGKKSLFVSGRTDNWNGACIILDENVYKPGEVFSFGAKVMQDSGSDAQMKLTLQYTKDGEHYDEVALAGAKSGEWTELANPAFRIPEGAEGMILYIESPDSLTDFYIDEAYGKAAE